MRAIIKFILVITVLIQALPAQAQETTLDELKNSVTKAYATKNDFVIDSVVDSAINKYPQYAAEIRNHALDLQRITTAATGTTTQNAPAAEIARLAQPAETAPAPAAEEKGEEKSYKGNIEGGINIQSGNTETEDYNIAGKLENDFGKLTNILKGSAVGGKEDGVRNEEEYRVNNQLRYNYDDRNYSFGELDYVNDRFSGYNYRVSELIGYGHYFIKEDDMKLSGEAGAGARQSDIDGEDMENTFLGKLSGEFDWKINERFSFLQELESNFGSEAVITNSASSVKTSLTDDLYLKFKFDVEHISDVPQGRENTDTTTSATLGYDF